MNGDGENPHRAALHTYVSASLADSLARVAAQRASSSSARSNAEPGSAE
jgi:hypothetical protein